MVNVKPKITVKLRTSADCPSHSLSNVAVRDLNFAIDEPVERGGTNLGPTPTDTAIAALVGCTNVIGHKCAGQMGIDIGYLKISSVCEFDRRGVTLEEEIEVPFSRIELTIEANGSASEDELQAVPREVAKYCPMSKLFRSAGTVIKENWIKSE